MNRKEMLNKVNNALSLQEIQKLEYDLLIKFHEYCEKNNLQYMVTYGSLIGAVRHQGFIPWDDDIDVMMPRADYSILINLLKEEKIENIDLLDSSIEEYYYPFAKLCDNRTIAKADNNKTEHGIWIDIFPIDAIPDNKLKYNIFQTRLMLLRDIIISYTTDFSTSHKGVKLLFKRVLSQYGEVVGKKKITNYMERYSQKYNKNNSDTFAAVIWQSAKGGFLKQDDILERVQIKFNDAQIYVPKNYDTYLRSLYGNYMAIPPKSKRKDHYLHVEWKNSIK